MLTCKSISTLESIRKEKKKKKKRSPSFPSGRLQLYTVTIMKSSFSFPHSSLPYPPFSFSLVAPFHSSEHAPSLLIPGHTPSTLPPLLPCSNQACLIFIHNRGFPSCKQLFGHRNANKHTHTHTLAGKQFHKSAYKVKRASWIRTNTIAFQANSLHQLLRKDILHPDVWTRSRSRLK